MNKVNYKALEIILLLCATHKFNILKNQSENLMKEPFGCKCEFIPKASGSEKSIMTTAKTSWKPLC